KSQDGIAPRRRLAPRGASCGSALGDREYRADQLGCKRFEFGRALGRGRNPLLLAHEPVTIGLDGACAESASDKIRWLAIEREPVRAGGSEQRAAVPSSDAHVAFVHRECNHLE